MKHEKVEVLQIKDNPELGAFDALKLWTPIIGNVFCNTRGLLMPGETVRKSENLFLFFLLL